MDGLAGVSKIGKHILRTVQKFASNRSDIMFCFKGNHCLYD